MQTWREAWRIAAWDPDRARELVIASVPRDDREQAHAAEVLAKIFAVTGAWSLARDAYEHAATSWELLDPARALFARSVAAQLPLVPFASDREALAAELDLVARSRRGEGVLVRRTLVEIRRALPPRSIPGQIEVAFRLAPGEIALVIAAMTSVVDAVFHSVEEWQQLLDLEVGIERLEELGLVSASPVLVPHPSLASRLLGRTTLDQPHGIRLDLVHPIGPPPSQAIPLGRSLADGIGVIYGERGSGRRTYGANIAGRPVIAARRLVGEPDILGALREVGLHDAVLAIDLDEWGIESFEAFARASALIAISREDPPIPREQRAFTIRTWRDEVSSSR